MSRAEHRAVAPEGRAVLLAVVTVSDTRTEATDVGGAEAARLIVEAGLAAPLRRIVADDVELIRAMARELVAHGDATMAPPVGPEPTAAREAQAQMEQVAQVDAVVFTGGTGFSPRDVTVEALAPLFHRTMEGFGELFRTLSFSEVGAAAMLSRATAGILSGVPIFLTPGSPAGVRLALERLILPELPHLLGQLRRSSRPPHPHPAPAGAGAA